MHTPPAPTTVGPTRTAQDGLSSRLIFVFTGLCYLCVAVSFSYLDRWRGGFSAVSLFWVALATLGFAGGSLIPGRAAPAGKKLSKVMTIIALILAIFPGFFMYTLVRWVCLVLLLITAARGPVMHTRRDLYLCLTTCFAVSFMVATHFSANWTLWFYLGPAWIFAGLALTWDYAPSKTIRHATRLGMNLGFVAATALIAGLLFFFLPRPPVLGFGFIPPAADASGLLGQPAGQPPGGTGTGQRKGTGKAVGPGHLPGDMADAGPGWQRRWQEMLEKMRPALKDPAIPRWQKKILGKLLDLAEMLGNGQVQPGDGDRRREGRRSEDRPTEGSRLEDSRAESGRPDDSRLSLSPLQLKKMADAITSLLTLLLAFVLVLVLGWLIYHRRYWLGIELLHFGAWLTASVRPILSMRMSAQAMKFCLREAGHKSKPGESVREYVAAAPGQPYLVRRWLGHAVELYCETRFGAVQATPARAKSMRRAVSAATQVVKGYAPELRKS